MMNQIKRILRKIQHKDSLNILLSDIHERYSSNVCKNSNHQFYSIQIPGLKVWEKTFSPIPSNYHILDARKPPHLQLPPNVEFDAVISGHKFGCFQTLYPISRNLGIPIISIEHTDCSHLQPIQIMQSKQMKADINLFITEYSMKNWGWTYEEGGEVLLHGIDDTLFHANNIKKTNTVLSVANDIKARGHLLGFDILQQVVQGLNFKLVGRNPGISEEAKDVNELVGFYQSASVFLNTSLISPIPMSMLEAMSSECAVVALPTCLIPSVIKHGENGLLGNNAAELRHWCQHLLQNPNDARRMGANARKTIQEKFGLDRFVKEWDNVLWRAASL